MVMPRAVLGLALVLALASGVQKGKQLWIKGKGSGSKKPPTNNEVTPLTDADMDATAKSKRNHFLEEDQLIAHTSTLGGAASSGGLGEGERALLCMSPSKKQPEFAHNVTGVLSPIHSPARRLRRKTSATLVHSPTSAHTSLVSGSPGGSEPDAAVDLNASSHKIKAPTKPNCRGHGVALLSQIKPGPSNSLTGAPHHSHGPFNQPWASLSTLTVHLGTRSIHMSTSIVHLHIPRLDLSTRSVQGSTPRFH